MNPRLVVCYVCGREYGSLSIDIHTPKCLEKWRVQNNHLPKSQRRPEPKKPQLQTDLPLSVGKRCPKTLQQLNEAAFQSAQDSQLIPCDICGRKFTPASLPRHQKACRPGVITFLMSKKARRHPRLILNKKPHVEKTASPRQLSSPVKSTVAAKRPTLIPVINKSISVAGKSTRMGATNEAVVEPPKAKEIRRPPTMVCYVCGREFGTKSIAIHEPKCLEKWQMQNSKLPTNMRKSLPKKPEILQGSTTRQTLEAANEQAYETFKSNLSQCPHCGRKFLPDRLTVHLRSCKG